MPDQPVNCRTAAQGGCKHRELQSQHQGLRDSIGTVRIIGIEVGPREPLMGGVLHLWFGSKDHGFGADLGDQLLQAFGIVQRVRHPGGVSALCGHLRPSSK